jgi:hypothetical protein
MQPEDIARAIRNIADADIPIAEQFIVLNHWRY